MIIKYLLECYPISKGKIMDWKIGESRWQRTENRVAAAAAAIIMAAAAMSMIRESRMQG